MFSSEKDKTYLDYLVKLLADKYVDSLDKQVLYQNGIEGIISSLDPHTVYIPPQETDRVNEELEGNIYGIGIEFFIYKDTIHILSILDNSPAKKAAVNPGDLILKIDDSLIAGKKLDDEDVIKLIKGRKNTFVSLAIQKPDGKINNIKLERETITYNSIIASYLLPHQKEIGCISIRMFSENTYQEFKEALQHLLDKKITKLIIDVRDNPGGYMDAVTSILDELIAGKHILLTTKSKDGNDIVESREKGIFESGKICVLINENSASASEILAGTLQDLDRGEIIGQRSYGKGLVQEQFSLPDNAAIRITVARYYLPSGRSIQKDYSHGKSEYYTEIYKRLSRNKPVTTDTTNQKQKYYTLSKRVVYGNEGIAPDILVDIDTNYNAVFDTMYAYNLIELFAADYYYFHKNDFQLYKTEYEYENEFNISNGIGKQLYDYIHSQLSSFSGTTLTSYKDKIFIMLKSEFAKLHFGNNARYMVMSNDDKVIQEAVRYLEK